MGIFLPSATNRMKLGNITWKRSFTCYRHLTLLDDQQGQDNLLASSHLLKKPIASRGGYFKQHEVLMQLQAVLFTQMQMSVPQIYCQCARESGIGPISIFQHIPFSAHYASFHPQHFQWWFLSRQMA